MSEGEDARVVDWRLLGQNVPDSGELDLNGRSFGRVVAAIRDIGRDTSHDHENLIAVSGSANVSKLELQAYGYLVSG